MIRINLLPVRRKQKEDAARRDLLLLVAGMLVTVGVGFLYYRVQASELARVEDRNAKIDREIKDLDRIIGEVDVLKEKERLLQQKLDVIRRLRANKTGPVHMLDELASHIPDRLWLTSLSEAGGKVQLEGVSSNNEVIATFMNRLDESPYFSQVYLVSIERTALEDLKLKKFSITARLVVPDAPPPGNG